jgi:hypothetical protein
MYLNNPSLPNNNKKLIECTDTHTHTQTNQRFFIKCTHLNTNIYRQASDADRIVDQR